MKHFSRSILRSGAYFGVLTLTVLSLASCGKPTVREKIVANGPPVEGDWVVIHDLADPESLNVLTSSDASASEIDAYIYETLINTDPITLKDVPWIADSLPKISDDRLSYDFHIRKDVKFSDGVPVTGADFIFYLKTLKNPMIIDAAPTRGYYERVDSAILVDGDPYHLRVIMNKPYYLGDQFAGGLYALPKHVWDPKGLTDKMSFAELNSNDTNNTNPYIKQFADSFTVVEKGMSREYLIGSGPYKFDEWRRNERVSLVRDPNYWNKGDSLALSYPEKLVWSSINDFNAALVSLRGGDLDVMPKLEKIQYMRVKDVMPSLGLKPAVYDYPGYTYVGYNALHPMFADKKVRQALAHLINRDAIIEKIYFGMARPVQSPLFYKRPECDTALPTMKYDPALAKKMLAEAGWTDSDGDGILDKVINGVRTPFKFDIMLNSGNQARQQMAILFVSELKKAGIDAHTLTLDWATYLKKTRSKDFDACIAGWAMEVREGDLSQIWASKSADEGGSNSVSFKNKRVDELLDAIRSEFDYSKRLPLYTELQEIIHDEQPYNFLVAEQVTGAFSDRFQNTKFYAPRPCYNAGWWWSPKGAQRYGNKAVAMN
ncbi:MAG: Peptide/nickel transport system substrate-binding protein [Chlorobi bacterium]|nr:Peptide/nickel transport system substrate-binding protein [Chlorobiota bacterium]